MIAGRRVRQRDKCRNIENRKNAAGQTIDRPSQRDAGIADVRRQGKLLVRRQRDHVADIVDQERESFRTEFKPDRQRPAVRVFALES